MMNIVGLGSESFEKYMSVINRLDNVKKLISDTKSCFKQFSNELKAENLTNTKALFNRRWK